MMPGQSGRSGWVSSTSPITERAFAGGRATTMLGRRGGSGAVAGLVGLALGDSVAMDLGSSAILARVLRRQPIMAHPAQARARRRHPGHARHDP